VTELALKHISGCHPVSASRCGNFKLRSLSLQSCMLVPETAVWTLLLRLRDISVSSIILTQIARDLDQEEEPPKSV
jgi:hypothetical protein